MSTTPSRQKLWLLLATAACLLSLAVEGAEPQVPARPPAFFGINDDPVWNFKAEELPAFERMLRGSGAGAVRMPIRWRVIEPKKGVRDFSAIDRAVKVIPPEVEILGILMSVPEWANGIDPKTAEGWADTYPPKDIADWERYVFETVSHYKGRIRHWEIWNEQNGIDFYRPLPDAAGYTALLKAAYQAAKKADPQCVVVLGGLQMNGIIPNPWSPVKTPDFLEALYRAGAGPFFDVCNIHPYVLPKEGAARMMSLIGDTLALMARHGDAGKPVWLTEVGCGATSPAAEGEQAELLSATFELAAKEPRIQRVFWFLLRDTTKDLLGPESTMGLFTHYGRAKPALKSFRGSAGRPQE